MIHGVAGDFLELGGALFATDEPCRVAHSGGVRRDVDEHEGPRPNLGALTDVDVPEKNGPCTDEDPVANLGVAIANGFPRSAQRDIVQDGHIAANRGRLAHHQSCCVVEENAGADLGRGVDVHVENLRHPALDQECQRRAGVLPEPMSHPVRLAGEKALEIQEAVTVRGACGILRPNCFQILPDSQSDALIAVEDVHNEPK